MTLGLSAIFALTVVALVIRHARALERLTALHDARIDRLVGYQQADKERWEAERRGLLANFGTERLAWERERGVLLNRIKPETRQYVPIHVGDVPSMPAPLPYDDDDAFWREVEERESKEEMAERLMAEEQERLNGSVA